MAVPLRIVSVNLVDTASGITASSFTGALTPDRVQVEDIQSVWRASSTTAWINVDLGAQYEVGMVVGINSNALTTDTKRVRVSTADATGAAGDAYDSGSVAADVNPIYSRLVQPIEPSVTGRYVRVDLTQTTAPEFGRLVIGTTWTPTHHFSYGFQEMWRDWSRVSYSLGRNVYYDRQPRQRGMRGTLNGLVPSESRNELEVLNRLAGVSQDVLVCWDINDEDLGYTTFWGALEQTVNASRLAPNLLFAELEIWDRL